jgi:succinoglycan biosynthesis transport protein ExoP
MAGNLPVERSSEDQNPALVAGAGAVALPPSFAPDGFAPPEQEGPPVDFGRILAAILRYKWLVLLLTIAGGTVGVLATKIMGPVYEAQSTIWMEIGPTRNGPVTEGPMISNFNWVDLLRSYTVLDSVVKEQRLFLTPRSAEDAAALRSFNLKERFQSGSYELKVDESGHTFLLSLEDGTVMQRGNIGDSVGSDIGFAWLPPAGAMRRGRVIGFSVVSPRQAALDVNARLNVKIPQRDGNFISMTLSGANPSRTAQTLNSLTEQFVHVAAELKSMRLHEQTRILDLQLQSSKQELDRAEAALETFKVNTITEPRDEAPPITPGLQSTQSMALANFFSMKTGQDDLRRDRSAIERVLAQPPDSGITAVTLEAIPSVSANADLRTAIADLSTKMAGLRALRTRYTDDNPVIVRALAEIQTLQRQNIPQMLRSLVDEMRGREGTLTDRVTAASRDLRQIPLRSIEESRLTRDVAIAASLYTNLQARYSEARLADASAIPDVRILDAAVTPDKPIKNVTMMLIAGGFGVGLGLAIALALLLDRMDRRLRYPDQVTRGMGLSILGALPRVKTNSAGMRGDDAQQVVEALRSIRLNLVNAYGSAGPLVTTITSPGSGDGKSFLASNLSLAFADAGHRTLLIDGDIRRGTLHRVLNVNRKPGLLDFLSGQATKEQIIQATRMPSVDFIGCGTRKMGGPELLASPAMSQMLISLRSQYSVIIIDSAPLGAGVDPLVLGSITGSLLLVLRTGVTDRELAQAKLSDLDRLPIRILGAVLNDVKAQGVYKYYSYLPGYSSDDEADAEAGARTLSAGKA